MPDSSPNPGRGWTIAGLVLLAAGLVIALTGGFFTRVGHIRVSAGRVVPEMLVGWGLIAWRLRRQDGVSADADSLRGLLFVRRHARHFAVAVAAATFAAGAALGVSTAAGADPSGYVSQARLWTSGNPVVLQSRLVLDAPWPNAEWSFAPLGYRASATRGVLVPTYASGLPLQMAALWHVIGERGAYLVVPALAAAIVWITFSIAATVCTAEAALVATLLVACGPVQLFHLVQPMSDVPVTAWWLAAIMFARRPSWGSALGAGLGASLAILTRPNLVPLVVPVMAFAVFSVPGSLAQAIRRGALVGAGIVPGILAVAALNTLFYGAATRSGYGTVDDIFGLANITANAARYPLWLWTIYSPYIFGLAVLPFVSPLARRYGVVVPEVTRRFGWLSVAFFVVLVACYAAYLPFDHWTYLRFLLPGIPLLLIGTTALLDAFLERWPVRWRAVALAVVGSVLPLWYISTAQHAGAFALKREFRERFQEVAAYVDAHTPADATFVSVNESGSLAYYAHRRILRYDIIAPEWLDRAATFLHQRGSDTYLLLEESELAAFESRFPSAAIAATLRRPTTVIGRSNRVFLFRFDPPPPAKP